ncbi:ANTAR domain-containing protein [Streptomyces globisporus]|nr:ANTAR domain-containing protein [Streptomyces globisporus]
MHPAVDGEQPSPGSEGDLRERVRQLERALASHVVVDQARGVLMAMTRCTPEEAWDMLVRISQHANVKARSPEPDWMPDRQLATSRSGPSCRSRTQTRDGPISTSTRFRPYLRTPGGSGGGCPCWTVPSVSASSEPR